MGQAGDTAQAIAGSHSLFHSQTVSKMQISILKKKKMLQRKKTTLPTLPSRRNEPGAANVARTGRRDLCP